jgi:uncharacterized repeat protein (TIGR04138 family)
MVVDMPATPASGWPRLKHPVAAYQFLFESLRFTQDRLGRAEPQGDDDEAAHITGQELVDGIREFAKDQFGLMALVVLDTWGIRETADFGHMVYELIERGQMRKTDRDSLEDFFDRYDFEEAFAQESAYDVDVSHAFKR